MQWYMQNAEQTSKTVSAIFYLKIKNETNRKWDIMNDNVISKLNKWNLTCQNFYITSLKAVMRELFTVEYNQKKTTNMSSNDSPEKFSNFTDCAVNLAQL